MLVMVRHLPPSVRRSRWGHTVRAAGFLIVGLLLAGGMCVRSSPPGTETDDHARYHDRTFRVARVIDGDTLDLAVPDGRHSTTRVRLWGVDAPEVGHDGAPSMYFGGEAVAFARRTLEGRTVRIVLVPRRTRGKYGRLLAYVYLEPDGRMFNEMLLEQGYAYADYRFPHPYADRFKRLERQARKADVGLWRNVTLDKMPSWRRRWERRHAGRGRNRRRDSVTVP
ncbi:MAG: hypothetical protein D6788_05715 [Planctomycetota bacterium]|nr:MAG: hypothetical protein D6788_05715 [Planctomycetota bacterium]